MNRQISLFLSSCSYVPSPPQFFPLAKPPPPLPPSIPLLAFKLRLSTNSSDAKESGVFAAEGGWLGREGCVEEEVDESEGRADLGLAWYAVLCDV